jgi:CO/xanthine dehydrogenase Mo-binding subunit
VACGLQGVLGCAGSTPDFVGAPVGLIVASSRRVAEAAAKEVEVRSRRTAHWSAPRLRLCGSGSSGVQVTYAETEAKGLFSMEDAAAAGSFLIPPGAMKKEVGDADAAMKTAAHVVTGEFKTGGQSHFCMEKQTTIAVPGEQVNGSE